MRLTYVKVVEEIPPYLVVTLDGEKYGLGDDDGFIYTSCDMDAIYECGDDDCFVIVLEKDGKYGFFFDESHYIEPTYDAFILDANGDIHLKLDGVYGIIEADGTEFKEVSQEESLLDK